MADYRYLLDTPAIPRLLEILLESEQGRDEPAVLDALGRDAYAVKAVMTLIGHGVVERKHGRLRIVHGDAAARKVEQLIAFYRNVQREAKKSLIFRGILNATYYKCLVHTGTFMEMMGQEGFDQTETLGALDEEVKQGYVQHMKIVYRSRSGIKHKFFPFIPLYYYPHFIVMNADNMQPLRSRLENAGIQLTEEDYLLGNYPKELAAQSRDFVMKEKQHIKEKIKSEAFDVWWYYRF